MGLFAIAGVLEGFYGKPWTWEERVGVMTQCVPAGLDWYVWAPKSDPLHRREWRVPFTDEHLEGFKLMLGVEGLKLGIAIAPGLSLNSDDLPGDVEALVRKLTPVIDIGATLVMVAFDDLDVDEKAGTVHAQIICSLMERFGDRPDIRWVAVPVHYAATESTDYLHSFSVGLPPDVLVGWTGPLVVNETISAIDAEAFADAVDGRPLLLWDNHPVNDAVMADRLFLLPPRGRDPLLPEFCGAYLANAGVQAWPSLPGLLGAAAYVTTGVAEAQWDELEDPVNCALLGQACDGRELFRLAELAVRASSAVAGADSAGADGVGADGVAEKAGDDLWWWLERMEELGVAGLLGEQASPWIEQAKVEAEVSLLALDLLEREPGDDEVAALLFTLFTRWPVVRRGTHTVFGSRFALTPSFGVAPDGGWRASAGALVENRNVTDLLCRAALALHQVDFEN